MFLKTAIICISDPYMKRGLLLKKYYEDLNDEVVVLTPDFSHLHKQKITEKKEGVVYLPHLPYKRNLSFSRMYGHYAFSFRCREFLDHWRPQRIHCLLPANSLAGAMAEYKKENPETLLYFDIIDLWPEALPIRFLSWSWPYHWWRKMRDDNLKAADQVFVECDMYKPILSRWNPMDFRTLYWSTNSIEFDSHPQWNEEILEFAYLGSVNNIIDLDFMELFFRKITQKKKCKLHLICKGERKEELIGTIGGCGVLIEDHHEIYDPVLKQKIFDQCRFGLNMMKKNVQVGLSMKSIDYMAAGLPMLNTLQGDCASLCDFKNAGFNLSRSNIDEVVDAVVQQSFFENQIQRTMARKVYENQFTIEHFRSVLDEATRKDTE